MICFLQAAEKLSQLFFFNENHLLFKNGLHLDQSIFKVLFDAKPENTQN